MKALSMILVIAVTVMASASHAKCLKNIGGPKRILVTGTEYTPGANKIGVQSNGSPNSQPVFKQN